MSVLSNHELARPEITERTCLEGKVNFLVFPFGFLRTLRHPSAHSASKSFRSGSGTGLSGFV